MEIVYKRGYKELFEGEKHLFPDEGVGQQDQSAHVSRKNRSLVRRPNRQSRQFVGVEGYSQISLLCGASRTYFGRNQL